MIFSKTTNFIKVSFQDRELRACTHLDQLSTLTFLKIFEDFQLSWKSEQEYSVQPHFSFFFFFIYSSLFAQAFDCIAHQCLCAGEYRESVIRVPEILPKQHTRACPRARISEQPPPPPVREQTNPARGTHK